MHAAATTVRAAVLASLSLLAGCRSAAPARVVSVAPPRRAPALAPAPPPAPPPVAPAPAAPVAPTSPPDADAAALPAEAWRVAARPWKVIAIHHSATARGGAAAFDAMHKAKGWDGVGYHFVVGNGTDTADGALETTFRWREQRDGAHVKGWNDLAVGICLVGNFEESDPTPAQLATLERLLRHLRRRFAVPPQRVVGHGRLGTTLCPGKRFPLGDVVARSDPAPAPASAPGAPDAPDAPDDGSAP